MYFTQAQWATMTDTERLTQAQPYLPETVEVSDGKILYAADGSEVPTEKVRLMIQTEEEMIREYLLDHSIWANYVGITYSPVQIQTAENVLVDGKYYEHGRILL